ncbi:MAG: hypothetical protein ACW963_02325 [Candidatus Sifarchaeia archaeon]
MPKFKPGMLVRIKDNTHQKNVPNHRIGLVMEAIPEEIDETKAYTSFYNIAFVGTNVTLKFHEMFLEIVDEQNK